MSHLMRRMDRIEAVIAPKGKAHLLLFEKREDITDETAAAQMAYRGIAPTPNDEVVKIIHGIPRDPFTGERKKREDLILAPGDRERWCI